MTSAKYIKSLDGVRAVAALLVIFFHFCQYTVFNSSIGKIIQKIGFLGQTGVSLFFVLSGFLITRILMSHINKNHYWKNFIIRRSLRIFPLYYGYLVVNYFIIPAFKGIPSPDLSLQFYYWFYLQDFSTTFHWPSAGPKHFWSLAVEEHFYLVWPFVVLYFKGRNLILSIVVIIISSLLTRWLLASYGFETYYFTFARIDEIAVGAFLAWMEKENLLSFFRSKYFYLLFSAVAICALTFWLLFSGHALIFIQVIKFNLIALAYALLIGKIITLEAKSLISRVLNSSFFNFTGKISYGLYVYQAIAIGWGIEQRITDRPVIFLISVMIICYTLAAISYYLFELPILKLKDRFTYSSHQQ